jgi:hypothetical protein
MGGHSVSELHLNDLAADLESYMAELSARRASACRVGPENPLDGRDTPDLFTILSEPWSDTEVEEFLELVKLPETL